MEPTEPQDRLDAPEAGPEALPDYEPPRVVTYRGDELLEALGPLQACTGFGSAVLVCP